MRRRADLAAAACRAALKLRHTVGRAANVPLCPYDVADEIGIEVRFADIPSLEAMYVDDGRPKIIIAADRPPGRQRYSCAHEIGHHVFAHGSHVATLELAVADRASLSDEEYVAQSFAGFLLLPKSAVSYAFATRAWDPREGRPEQYFAVASHLGVSFEALVTHCSSVLGLLSAGKAAEIRRANLPNLRERLAGQPIPGSLVVLDEFGLTATADVSVGDHILASGGALPLNDALALVAAEPSRTILRAVRPGLSGLQSNPNAMVTVVRVARAGFAGRSVFRHLEEPGDE